MSADSSAATVGSEVRRRWRRWRLWVFLALVTGLAGVLIALTGVRSVEGRLDPRSAGASGARAVTQILQDHGVAVTLATTSADALAGAGSDTTIVVTRAELLGPDQLERLRTSPSDLVLVEPGLTTLATLTPTVRPAGPTMTAAQARCTDPDATAAGTVTGHGTAYRFTGPGHGCYPDAQATDLFTLVRVETGDRRVTILGQGDLLTNDYLADEGNAALALRLLGQHSQVTWYQPEPAELGLTDPPSVTDLLPPWVAAVAWQLAIVTGSAIVWRARRLGRLVREPLPVVVRSAQTQEGRARLYRQAKARGLAAATVRTAALRRLAPRLGVSPQADPTHVAYRAAAVTGRPPPGPARTSARGRSRRRCRVRPAGLGPG